MRNVKVTLYLLMIVGGLLGCSVFSVLPTATPDRIATLVAEEQAAAATLTAMAKFLHPEPTHTATNLPATPPELPLAPTNLAQIYFTVGRMLYRMNLDGTALELISDQSIQSEHLFVDHLNQRVYASSWDNSIQLFDIPSQQFSIIPAPGSGGQGIAVTFATANIFLGLYSDGVYSLDREHSDLWTQLVSPADITPLYGQRGQLQIDPVNRLVYFRTAFDSPCDQCRMIWRVDFDGLDLTSILPANGGDALTLDLAGGKLYFSDDPGNGTLLRANLDGSGLETLFRVPPPYNFCRDIALDLVNQKIYLSLFDESDYLGRAIARANIDGSEFELLFETRVDTPEAASGGMGLDLP